MSDRRPVPNLLRRILDRLRNRQDCVEEPHPRPLREREPSLGVPFRITDPSVAGAELPRRAVVAHLFHADLAPEFRNYFSHIPGAVDLYLSTDTDEKLTLLESSFAGWAAGAVAIHKVPNVGRDMAPKFVTFADVYPRYDAVLCVHSKKSDYLQEGGDWRTTLMQTLCGSPDTVASVLRIMAQDTGVGLVFPDHFPGIVDRLSWGGNRVMAGELAGRAGLPIDRATGLEFVSGSMFWARPAALAPLLHLRLRYDDFPAEAGQLDATLAHALERLLLYSTETAGLSWVKIADPRCYPPATSIKRLDDDTDLPAVIASCRTVLIPPA